MERERLSRVGGVCLSEDGRPREGLREPRVAEGGGGSPGPRWEEASAGPGGF